MTTPCIITVAEQVEPTQEAFEVGATLVRAHVRNDRYVQSKRDQRNGRMNGVVRSTISGTSSITSHPQRLLCVPSKTPMP